MRIEWVRIESFRSFRESPRIPIAPNRTVIVGKNNAGKSALLEALTLSDGMNDPHRSPKTVDLRGVQPLPTRLDYGLSGTGLDLSRWMRRATSAVLFPSNQANPTGVAEELKAVLAAGEIRIQRTGGTWEQPAFGLVYSPQNNGWAFALGTTSPHFYRATGATDIREAFAQNFIGTSIFRFRAERMNIGEGDVQLQRVLSSDASNLPTVLHELQSRNRAAFDDYCATVSRILPGVHNVQVPVVAGGRIEIRIWPNPTSARRDDLAISLKACGTGISQVLAMLFAVLASDEPRTLLIDEPNSFLHPSAVFELIDIFREHPEHQYVIATHSPEVIAAFDPEIIQRLELENGETRVESLDPKSLADQRRILLDVGARLSSVFGADKILWVEGHTEEEAFPKIVHHFAPQDLRGVRILRVDDTGRFEARHAEVSAKLYERLGHGAALIPPAVGFLLDRERRSETEIEKLRSLIPSLCFLKRRMTECYLLHSNAIAHVLSEDLGEPVSPERVNEELANAGFIDDANYMEKVDASKILSQVFTTLSETRVAFSKPSVPVRVVEWLLEHEPAFLRPLFKEIQDVLCAKPSSGLVVTLQS